MASEMTEARVREIEAAWKPDAVGIFLDPLTPRANTAVVADLIAALRQARQERDIEAKAALACNDALVRERAALAAAQAERDALRQRFDTFRATRNREQDSYVQANHEFAAALTEARRVLRLVDKQARRECPVCFSPGWTHKEGCALAAVLAEGKP